MALQKQHGEKFQEIRNFSVCGLLISTSNSRTTDPAWDASVLLNYEHLLSEQKVRVKSDSSYSFQFNKMARPAGLEPAAFCLEATQYKTLSAASGVAYEEARHLSRP